MTQNLNPAWQAAIREHRLDEVARLLAESPALVDERIVHTRKNGTTYAQHPLVEARQSLAMTRLLVEAGADVNTRDPGGGTTPMMGPCFEVAKFLVERGADIDAFGYEELTPLAYAVYVGNLELVRYLLDEGARIDRAHPAEGITPLHYAARKSDLAMLRLLCDRGADRTCRDAEGKTPLDWALAASREAEVLAMLGAGSPNP